MTWFIRRFPALERRCRTISAEDASIGAVPVHDAKPVPVGEPGHITDVGQGAGGDDGSDAEQVHQR
ncbi:MAG TPA: hypothetical protein VGN48_05885 [Pedococcus sp.]|jgi:hypothetical protein|nr:hypothetical protein [Pedococcus sp.]